MEVVMLKRVCNNTFNKNNIYSAVKLPPEQV